MAYGEPIEANATVDLNSQWILESEDNEYRYFKSDSNEADTPFSQFKVTWSNLTSITFKYMSSSDMGILFVLKLDSEKFTDQSSEDDIYMATFDKTPGTYYEFTIECDEGEHHIWFAYAKNPESATDEDRGFIGVPKYVSPVIDAKQGAELPTEYKSGGVSAEGSKTYNINFKNVILPNGSNIVLSYEDYTKTEKTITYEYVDLGLSVKWAKCNVGATSETDYGVYFQWGETSGVSGSLVGKYSDENYSWASYTHCKGGEQTLTKYNQNSSYGTVDKKFTLDPEDDAATQIMGSDWRMPTKDEFQELIDNTTQEWITDYNGSGVDGYKFTSIKEGYQSNSIFIPAAGSCSSGSVGTVGGYGYVWSSSLGPSNPYYAWYLSFYSGSYYMDISPRYDGRSVRGVRK